MITEWEITDVRKKVISRNTKVQYARIHKFFFLQKCKHMYTYIKVRQIDENV